MTSPESPSSIQLSRWIGQETQAPQVLEYKSLPSTNGQSPRSIPYRWLCGRDGFGNQTDPAEVRDHESLQYVPNLKYKATAERSEWQGALSDHPAVADSPLWAMPTLTIDLSREAIAARIIAFSEAKSANETPVYQPDALQASRSAL